MDSKVSKKISKLSFNQDQILTTKNCGDIKGGGYYYCCTRNRWIQY